MSWWVFLYEKCLDRKLTHRDSLGVCSIAKELPPSCLPPGVRCLLVTVLWHSLNLSQAMTRSG